MPDTEARELEEGATGSDEVRFADQLVDDLLPDEVDWRRLVTRYPLPSLAIAGVGGYLLGKSRGAAIVAALAALATDTVSRNVNALVGEEIL